MKSYQKTNVYGSSLRYREQQRKSQEEVFLFCLKLLTGFFADLLYYYNHRINKIEKNNFTKKWKTLDK